MNWQNMTEHERKTQNLLKLNELREVLKLPTPAHSAWQKLRPAERLFFIKSARISTSLHLADILVS
jgi:hypothetical protein